MPRLNVPRLSRGFTIAEMLIIAAVIGILTVVMTPNLAKAVDRVKLNQSVMEVRGALQEAQRQAIRSNEPCSVTISATDQTVRGSCLMTGNRTLAEHVRVVSNIIPNVPAVKVDFGVLGTAAFSIATNPPTPDPSGKIILYFAKPTIPDQKCIVVSNTLGLSRVGNYTGPTGSEGITDSGVCTTRA